LTVPLTLLSFIVSRSYSLASNLNFLSYSISKFKSEAGIEIVSIKLRCIKTTIKTILTEISLVTGKSKYLLFALL